MAHSSDTITPLAITTAYINSTDALNVALRSFDGVALVRLPAARSQLDYRSPLSDIGKVISTVSDELGPNAVLIVLGETIDLVEALSRLSKSVRYQEWIAIERKTPITIPGSIPNAHFGALILSRYEETLRHTRTRIAYTYCPTCHKTTKDYGGKKHTYHEYGTAISDVWRDVKSDLDGDISLIIQRFADLFGLRPYIELRVLDCSGLHLQRSASDVAYDAPENPLSDDLKDKVIAGDCITLLSQIPDNSIDFVFADPPYNLKKKYLGYSDDLETYDYLTWCEHWLMELARIVKPGHTVAVLNIPIIAVTHFTALQKHLRLQNWIVWDALAFPVRMIMPAHYTILCFTKGESRKLPCFTGESKHFRSSSSPKSFNALEPLADGYCLRENCVDTRIAAKINDRATLTDLWTDIHRLKHNSRRVDHPTQLPPHLMYRIISIFTKPNEVVLDCFNGSGTTTLAAHQLGRKYLGIESSEKYWNLSNERHQEILDGLDPFRKMERVLTSKNSPVPRLKKQVYKVPKKTLQLEVKRVAKEIGHIPTRDELITFGKYPIEYYDKYFVSWGEVTAAARTTGMSENRNSNDGHEATQQLRLLERKASFKT